MTPLLQPKGAAICAGRRATTASPREEASAGDWAARRAAGATRWAQPQGRLLGQREQRGAQPAKSAAGSGFSSCCREWLRCSRGGSAQLDHAASRQSHRTRARSLPVIVLVPRVTGVLVFVYIKLPILLTQRWQFSRLHVGMQILCSHSPL